MIVPATAPSPPDAPEHRERLQTYLLAMIRNQHREIVENFQVQIEFDADQLAALSETQGIREIAFLDELPVWSHTMQETVEVRVRVSGRSISKEPQGIAKLKLTAYPAIVAARGPLRRGQRVTNGDLQYLPHSAQAGPLPSDVVQRPEDIVDLEVVGLVRGGVALSLAAFAAPRVVRRGDLLEVQVGGGGVRVTTGAKALGDGAVNDLIEIETLSPKRRLLARVVHSSLVEIITQAPRVRAEPAANSQGSRQR